MGGRKGVGGAGEYRVGRRRGRRGGRGRVRVEEREEEEQAMTCTVLVALPYLQVRYRFDRGEGWMAPL